MSRLENLQNMKKCGWSQAGPFVERSISHMVDSEMRIFVGNALHPCTNSCHQHFDSLPWIWGLITDTTNNVISSQKSVCGHAHTPTPLLTHTLSLTSDMETFLACLSHFRTLLYNGIGRHCAIQRWSQLAIDDEKHIRLGEDEAQARQVKSTIDQAMLRVLGCIRLSCFLFILFIASLLAHFDTKAQTGSPTDNNMPTSDT